MMSEYKPFTPRQIEVEQMANLEDAGKVEKALRCAMDGSIDRDVACAGCDNYEYCYSGENEQADAADLLDAQAAKIIAQDGRIAELEAALANMWFAYENKDTDGDMPPHTFETEAVEMAATLLGKWESVMPRLLEIATKWNQTNTATLEAKLAEVTRERDALIKDLNGRCDVCAHLSDSTECLSCSRLTGTDNWKWRGVCAENTGIARVR